MKEQEIKTLGKKKMASQLDVAGGSLEQLRDELYPKIKELAKKKMTLEEVVTELHAIFDDYYRERKERKEPAVEHLHERAARFFYAIIRDPYDIIKAKQIWRSKYKTELWPYIPEAKQRSRPEETGGDDD